MACGKYLMHYQLAGKGFLPFYTTHKRYPHHSIYYRMA